MARVTRGGTTFSPYEFDPRDFGPALANIRVEAIRLENLRAVKLDDQDEGAGGIPPPHPSVPAANTSIASTFTILTDFLFTLAITNTSVARLALFLTPVRTAGGARYAAFRTACSQPQTARRGGKTQAPESRKSSASRAAPYKTTFDAANLPSSSTAWTGPRLTKKAQSSRPRARGLKALLEDDNDLVEWEGIDPMLILDVDGRIVAVLLGRPEGDDWEEVVKEFIRLMEAVRRRGEARGVFKAKDRRHRRGNYFTLSDGVTRGPGQQKPGNLAHSSKAYRRLLELVISNYASRRIVGFLSSGLARYLPKLYDFYRTTLKGIFDRHPELKQLFDNSVFPAATWNLGPQVVTDDHVDELNLPHGMCGVFNAGDHKHKRGGHMFLKQLRLVIEFPSGSSMLIPSASITHSNVRSASKKTVLAHHGSKALLSEVGGAAKKLLLDGEPGQRAAWAMGLLSKADELDADRRAVFGSQADASRFVDFAHALCATEHGSRAIELRQLRAVVEDHLGQDVQNIYDRAVEALRALKPIDGAAWEKAKVEAEAERDESYRLRRARLDARVAAARAEWGLRETHAVPLTAEDFYLDDARPTELPSVLMGHTCTICLNAKSHPVS
ncbi:hypothetical protein B0H13DRAFT_2684419 [Mycena leptocephala]|nr:hypothetical protein B0H13DRAFT_2684419 [Mycena leptocephala]